MEINRLSEFTESLTKIKSISHKTLFFRGHSNLDYTLKPTLYRKEKFYLSEDKIFKDILLSCPQDFSNTKNTMEILVKMQHYGVPTRILDLTKNALVALFFACESNYNEDGEVLLLHIPNKEVCYFDSDKVSILSNIAKQNISFMFEYPSSFDNEDIKQVEYINKEYFGYLLHSIKEEKSHFKDIINPRDLEKVFAVQAKLDNPRIIRQGGAFLIFGVKNTKFKPAEVPSEWILKPNGESIIIPKSSKLKILEELDILGINRSTLFPELEDQAGYIKKKYTNDI